MPSMSEVIICIFTTCYKEDTDHSEKFFVMIKSVFCTNSVKLPREFKQTTKTQSTQKRLNGDVSVCEAKCVVLLTCDEAKCVVLLCRNKVL